MNTDSLGRVVVSAQMGCSLSDFAIRPFHRQLHTIFGQMVVGDYFRSISYISIVIRASGALANFQGEGPERLKYRKGANHIAIDLVVPEWRWRGVLEEVLREYLADKIDQCFELLLKKASSIGELVDESALRKDFELAMSEFRMGGRES